MKRKRAQPDLPTCAAAMGPAARGAVPVPWPSRVGDTTSMAHCRAHRAPAPLAPWRQMRHNSVVLSTEPAGGGPAPGVRWTDGPADHGAVAQLGERLNRTQEVRGSNPLSSTQKCHGPRVKRLVVRGILSQTCEYWAPGPVTFP